MRVFADVRVESQILLFVLVLIILPCRQARAVEQDARLTFQPTFSKLRTCSLEAVAWWTHKPEEVKFISQALTNYLSGRQLSSRADFSNSSVLDALTSKLLEEGVRSNSYVRHLRVFKQGDFFRYETEEDFFGKLRISDTPQYKCTWILRPSTDASPSICYFINNELNQARITTIRTYRIPPPTWELLTYSENVRAVIILLLAERRPPNAANKPPSLDEQKFEDLLQGRAEGLRLESESFSSGIRRTKLFAAGASVPMMELTVAVVGAHASPLIALLRNSKTGKITDCRIVYYGKDFKSPAGAIAFGNGIRGVGMEAAVCRFGHYDEQSNISPEVFDLVGPYKELVDENTRTFYTNGVAVRDAVWADRPLKKASHLWNAKPKIVVGVFLMISSGFFFLVLRRRQT